MRLRLTIAYDGRQYAGWQSQPAGNAVQDFLEKAFRKIAGTRVAVHGSGRTDAGVHALGQCAHVEVFGSMEAGDWQRALNASLPPTIRMVRVAQRGAGLSRALFGERKGLPLSHSEHARSTAA